ncbi:MAG: Gamma-glutamylputrescine oxidoreductase [Gammaproteobacteria bacterium]|nr:Gamma-glutamylputrescine oxidoreductase [Gammaproteobacteria bacterium]
MRQQVGSDAYHGGYLDTGAGHLHPLNYALGLAESARQAGVRIFEGARAVAYSDENIISVETHHARIRCGRLVLACNGYLGDLAPKLAGKIMPVNNFMLATEPLREERARSIIRDDVAVSDSKFVINYFRLSADKRLLFGGGETYSRRFPRDIGGFVRLYMLRIYPQLADAAIDYAWGGTLAITLNRLPHLGRLGNFSKSPCNVGDHVGVGLSFRDAVRSGIGKCRLRS